MALLAHLRLAPGQGGVVVFHDYRVFGRTTRLSHGHDSRPIRKKSYPYKANKWWGWRTWQPFNRCHREGQRLISTRDDYVGIEADRRINVGRKLSKNTAQYSTRWVLPYPYKRR